MNQGNSSIDALVTGLKDGGCSYVTNFPGFNSHIFFDKLGGKHISTNERVAYELAYGASMAGNRSVVVFKGVGLNIAADSFLHSVLNGLNAGIVVILTEDIEAVSSPESQDSRPYRDIFGGLWLEPTSVQKAYEYGYQAFEWSEKFNLPVVIRLTNQFFKLNGKYLKKPIKNKKKLIEKNRDKYISFWKTRDDNLKKKLAMVDLFIEKSNHHIKKSSKTKGIIVVGNCHRELKTYSLSEYETLYLSTYPLPKSVIKQFCRNKSEIIVLEQGINYAFRQIKNIINLPRKLTSNTGDRFDQSKSWQIHDDLNKLFKALKETDPSFVVGDEGTFTNESTQTIETCLSMGSSVGIAAGLTENNVDYPFCIIGDTSFVFSGQQTLIEAKKRGLNFGIVIIDNGGAKSTGGQKNTGDIYNIGDVPSVTVDYEETSKKQFIKILSKMKNRGKLAALFIKTK